MCDRFVLCWLIIQFFSTCSLFARDENDDAGGIAFFESKIRPVLVKHCYACHSAESGNMESGLALDSKRAVRTGGDRGAGIIPGDASGSILIAAIAHADPDLKMPPDQERLPDQVIADFRHWIQSGAPDPRTAGSTSQGIDIETAREFWAYQKPQSYEVPVVKQKEWPRSTIDHFILASLEANALQPSADAEPRILLRRLHFDLIGLPPSPPAVDRFLAACRTRGIDQALQNEVDQLLKTKQFGERWGRHWLDVARFGESSGKEANISFPHAWRYRDYVIDSVNRDIPVDVFITEQIAGDLLPYQNDSERARLLIATGFLAVGTKNLGEMNERQFQADIIDEQIDSLSRAIMSSSVGCARCHHHKFDPFSMQDYYGLAGIFASTKTYFGTFTSPANNRSGDPLPLPRLEGQQIFNKSLSPKQFSDLKARYAELMNEWNEIEAAKRARFAGKQPEREFTLREVLANIWRRGPIEGKLETLDKDGKALPLAMGVTDRDNIIDVPLLARGEISRPGDLIPRAFPQIIPAQESNPIPADQSGRLQLARWLTAPEHPLTSRVFVNRVWQHLFGTGLVATVDNFGTTGDSPSHPELLDTMAIEFANDGWSLKRLIHRFVRSRTYRQKSSFDRSAFQRDPENRLLWRMPKRRLQAEAIRDAMLAVSGELDTTRPAGSLVARVIGDRPISLIGLNKRLPKDLDGSTHRSVYLPVIRDRLPDVLELFDFAEPSLVTGQRETTNVPVQALYLMNSAFVQARARSLAARLKREQHSDHKLVDRAFQLCFTRLPTAAEQKRAIAFLEQNRADTSERQTDDLLLASFCQALLSTAEFRNLD